MKVGLAIGIVVLGLMICSPVLASEADGIALRIILESLDAEAVACPDGIEALGVVERATCATSTAEFQKFPKLLRKAVEEADKPGTAGLAEMRKNSGAYAAVIRADAELYNLWFESDGFLAIVPVPSCFPADVGPQAMDLEGVEGFVKPKLHEPRAKPVFPAEARRHRKSGMVTFDVVIREDGTIGRICEVYSHPHGYGFEEAAREAVEQWSYEPARLDGNPITLVLRVQSWFTLY